MLRHLWARKEQRLPRQMRMVMEAAREAKAKRARKARRVEKRRAKRRSKQCDLLCDDKIFCFGVHTFTDNGISHLIFICFCLNTVCDIIMANFCFI